MLTVNILNKSIKNIIQEVDDIMPVKYWNISLLLFLFILIGCTPIKNEDKLDGYSICLGEFVKYEDAELFKSKLDFELWDKLKIESVEDIYFLIYGNYDTSFEAGKKAFELFRRSLINNYKILYKEKYVYDNYANLLFIGKYQGRPSVYIYNMAAKESKLFWSRWGRKVTTLNHSKDRSYSFFVTALGYGKQGSFPYVRDTRIYRFTGSDELVEELDELGDGLQVYTYWDAKDTFKVNITKPDSIKSDLLIQEINSYNYQGKTGQVKQRVFSLTEDGFPKPPDIQPQLISNNNTRLIRLAQLDSEIYIYLKTNPVGVVSTDENYVLWPERKNQSRIPDVSFVAKDRLPKEQNRFLPIAPDLAVEILSPTNNFDEVMLKAEEYLQQGTQIVWVVIVSTREVIVCTAEGKHFVKDVLTAPQLLPGFELPVKTIFAGL